MSEGLVTLPQFFALCAVKLTYYFDVVYLKNYFRPYIMTDLPTTRGLPCDNGRGALEGDLCVIFHKGYPRGRYCECHILMCRRNERGTSRDCNSVGDSGDWESFRG